MKRNVAPFAAAALLAVLADGCARSEFAPESAAADLVGSWRAVLRSPGGELPFELRIRDNGGELQAVAVNGAEEAPFSSVRVEDHRVLLAFSFYDSEIVAERDGDHLSGHWRKVVPEGTSTLPFSARRLRPGEASTRFFTPARLAKADSSGSVDGSWAVEFTDEDGTEVARGEFAQNGARVTGTFLTPTGDYRFLEGVLVDRFLRLSAFDGGHAFLFHAELHEDGTLSGDFWSRDTYHATWTARPAEDHETVLPDAWSLVGLTNRDGHFGFEFPDLDGRLVSSNDDRFKNKVVLVNIFGSWCPNCNDKAPLLAGWHREYRDRGLEIVGLAYEFTGDPERDARQVRRYSERHAIEFPLLLAGLSDKREAGRTLADLSALIAYPTSVFIDREGVVRRIHTGFAGPGTGEHFLRLTAEFEELLEELLVEAPAGVAS